MQKKNFIENPSPIKFLKSKMKCDGDKATDFHDTEIAEVESNCTRLLVVLTDFVIEEDESYYPQAL